MAKPSAAEERWFEAAKRFTPDQSLERSQTLANFVFANVAVVGTLLAGLGIVADKGAGLRSAPRVGEIPLPVLLVGVSLLFASIALWPKLGNLNPNRVDEVERWYKGQILRRGIAVIVALVALSAAIVVATLSFAAPALNDVTTSTALEGSGSETKLSVKVEIAGASKDAVAHTKVEATTRRGARRPLYRATTHADTSGAIKLEVAVEKVGSYRTLIVKSIVVEGGEELARRRVTIPVRRRGT